MGGKNNRRNKNSKHKHKNNNINSETGNQNGNSEKIPSTEQSQEETCTQNNLLGNGVEEKILQDSLVQASQSLEGEIIVENTNSQTKMSDHNETENLPNQTLPVSDKIQLAHKENEVIESTEVARIDDMNENVFENVKDSKEQNVNYEKDVNATTLGKPDIKTKIIPEFTEIADNSNENFLTMNNEDNNHRKQHHDHNEYLEENTNKILRETPDLKETILLTRIKYEDAKQLTDDIANKGSKSQEDTLILNNEVSKEQASYNLNSNDKCLNFNNNSSRVVPDEISNSPVDAPNYEKNVSLTNSNTAESEILPLNTSENKNEISHTENGFGLKEDAKSKEESETENSLQQTCKLNVVEEINDLLKGNIEKVITSAQDESENSQPISVVTDTKGLSNENTSHCEEESTMRNTQKDISMVYASNTTINVDGISDQSEQLESNEKLLNPAKIDNVLADFQHDGPKTSKVPTENVCKSIETQPKDTSYSADLTQLRYDLKKAIKNSVSAQSEEFQGESNDVPFTNNMKEVVQNLNCGDLKHITDNIHRQLHERNKRHFQLDHIHQLNQCRLDDNTTPDPDQMIRENTSSPHHSPLHDMQTTVSTLEEFSTMLKVRREEENPKIPETFFTESELMMRVMMSHQYQLAMMKEAIQVANAQNQIFSDALKKSRTRSSQLEEILKMKNDALEAFKAHIADLETQKISKTPKDVLDNSHERIFQLEQTIEKLQSELDSSHNTLATSNMRIIELKSELQQSEERNIASKDELLNSLKRISELEETVQTSQTDINTLQDIISTSKTHFTELEERMQMLQENLTPWVEKLRIAQEHVTESKNKLQQSEMRITELEEKLKTSEMRITVLEETEMISQANLDLAKDTLQISQKRVNELEQALQTSNARMIDLEDSLKASQTQVIELEGQLQTSETCITKLNETYRKSLSNINNLENDLLKSQARVIDLEGKVKILETQCAKSDEALEKSKSCVGELEERLIISDVRLTEIKEAARMSQSNYAKIEKELLAAQKCIINFEENQKILREHITKINKALNKSQLTLAETNEELQDSQAHSAGLEKELEKSKNLITELESALQMSQARNTELHEILRRSPGTSVELRRQQNRRKAYDRKR